MTATKRTTKRAKIVEHPIEHAATCQCPTCADARAKDRPPCLIGYARVSTTDQKIDLQFDALKRAGCTEDRIFIEEGVSGSKTSRPKLDACLASLIPGDTLVVWKLDRLGRSMTHLVQTVENLNKRGVGFKSVTEAIDTTSAAGKLFLGIFASFAEFERQLIIERVTAGIAAKKNAGGRTGRMPRMTAEQILHAKAMRDAGKPLEEIRRVLGGKKPICRTTLWRSLNGVAA